MYKNEWKEHKFQDKKILKSDFYKNKKSNANKNLGGLYTFSSF